MGDSPPERASFKTQTQQEFVCIGRVLKPQGLQGEIKVEAFTGRKEDILGYGRVFLAASADAPKREYAVVKARLSGTAAVLRLAACSSREEAEELRGQYVWLSSLDLPQLAAKEFYLHTLMGKEACTSDGHVLGRISAVVDTDAHSLLVARDGRREVLIPAVAAFISRVEDDTVVFELPEGLLDINADRNAD